MEVIVVSDTHGDIDFIDSLCTMYPLAIYLHAGDSMKSAASLLPFKTVKGNCDFFIKNRFLIERICDVSIYVFHGHMYPLDVYSLSRLAKNNNCDILIYGHTHIPFYEYYNGVHIICPGSVTYPRANSKASYARIVFSNKLDIEVKILEYTR